MYKIRTTGATRSHNVTVIWHKLDSLLLVHGGAQPKYHIILLVEATHIKSTGFMLVKGINYSLEILVSNPNIIDLYQGMCMKGGGLRGLSPHEKMKTTKFMEETGENVIQFS